MLRTQSPANPTLECILGIIPGLLVFVFLTNGVILNPGYTAWLTGDAFLAWQGWQFFRLSPLIQWPLGANPFFGLDISSSIVFPDSVPLMAFIFKPFSALLPTEFQYFGIFILACFLLQSLYAYKILRIYSSTILPAFFGSALFVLAPILLVRLTETYQHHALFSQWVILAALYFYLRNNFSYAAWIALQVITLLINVYLFSMVFSVFLADLVQRKYLKQITLKTISILIPTTISFIIFIMWAAGFFMVGSPGAADGLSGGGFGFYRMNLLSPIDSNLIWSKIIPDFYTNDNEGEGFNFLGLGALILIPFGLYSAMTNRRSTLHAVMRLAPLVLLAFFCTVYAVSNQIFMGAHKVLQYQVPSHLNNLFKAFSSSGRFFWIPNYLTLIGICYYIIKINKKYLIIILFIAAIFFQTLDSFRAFTAIKNHLIIPNNNFAKLDSDLWKFFASKYKNIIYIDTGHIQSPDILSLYEFSSRNKMAINANWQSKFNNSNLIKYKEKISRDIILNRYDSASLYIFKNNETWDYALDFLNSNNHAFHSGSYKIIAPNFTSKLQSPLAQDLILPYSKPPGKIDLINQTTFAISFLPNGNFQKFRGLGWSHPEPDGTWTDGSLATIRASLNARNDTELVASFIGKAFVNEYNPSETISIYLNNNLLKEIIITKDNQFFNVNLSIPLTHESVGNEKLIFSFRISNPKSPNELALGNDNRLLGIQLNTAIFKAAKTIQTKQ